jgi:AAA domain
MVRSDPLPQDMQERAGIAHAKANGEVPAEVGRLLSIVKPERVEWIWRGRIPKGKLTIIEGDPGDGKSTLTADMAARKSVGRPWPDGEECEVGGVVLCSAEDGLADTIRPRLDAAGGDPERVLALATVPDGDSERLLSIPKDLAILRRGIERVGATLVVIDPLSAFLSGKVNTHRDADVRRALAPTAKLAEDTGAAIVVVRHLNQTNGGNPLYRGQGSIGIVGAARCALLVARHPEDEGRRVLASLKSNLAEPAPSLNFVLVESANGSARVEWKGETTLSAAALLSAPTDPEERSALEEAVEFLRDGLGSGPVESKQVRKDARAAGITDITLKRAKSALGVRSKKQSTGPWAWEIPEENHEPYTSQVDPLDPLPVEKVIPRQRGEGQEDHPDPLDRGGDSRAIEPSVQGEGAQGDQEDHSFRNTSPRLSAEQDRKVSKLVREGMAPELARREVLGDWEV